MRHLCQSKRLSWFKALPWYGLPQSTPWLSSICINLLLDWWERSCWPKLARDAYEAGVVMADTLPLSKGAWTRFSKSCGCFWALIFCYLILSLASSDVSSSRALVSSLSSLVRPRSPRSFCFCSSSVYYTSARAYYWLSFLTLMHMHVKHIKKQQLRPRAKTI